MAETRIQCPGCGLDLPRPSEREGGAARCPGCGTVWRPDPAPTPAPKPEPEPAVTAKPPRSRWSFRRRPEEPPAAAAPAPSPETGEPRLRLNRATLAGEPATFCPACGVARAADDRYCSQCGYNYRTGRFAHQEHLRRRRLAVFVLALTLGGLVAAAFAPGIFRLPDRWPSFRLPQKEAPSEPPAPRTEEEIAALAETIAGQLRARLDESHPLARRGEPIELTLDSGQVLSGVYWGVSSKDNAIVEVEGRMMDAPLKHLRAESRLLVDPAFREETIRARARRRAESGASE